MKKLLSVLMLTICVVTFSFAQHHKRVVVERHTKVKRTSTLGQKVHNVFHNKHKHYNGYKTVHTVKRKHI